MESLKKEDPIQSVLPKISKKQRIIALDAARGLAVIGMFIQHFALNDFNASIVSGNTMILFILCSGISYSLMSQRMIEKEVDPTVFRAQMLARAVFIDLIGYILIMLNGPFAVILPAYAVLFVLALMLFRRSTRTLVTTSIISFVLSPPIMILGLSLFEGIDLLGDIAGGPLSALALIPVFTAGMAIGRLDLSNIRIALKLAIGGAILLIATKLFTNSVLPGLRESFESWLLTFSSYASPQIDPYAVWPLNITPPAWQMLLYPSPQTGSTFQLMIGTGVALLVLGTTCLIETKGKIVLKPFAAVGRVALTLYVAHIVLGWILQLAGLGYALEGIPFGDLMVALVTLLIGGLLSKLPMGPFEAALRRFDKLFSRGL